jgi:hypothetical protein
VLAKNANSLIKPLRVVKKKGTARTLCGHFFDLFCCPSAIKEIHHFVWILRNKRRNLWFSCFSLHTYILTFSLTIPLKFRFSRCPQRFTDAYNWGSQAAWANKKYKKKDMKEAGMKNVYLLSNV